MRLYVRNKVITLGGSSYVLDETGREVFEVKGRWISPTRVKWIKTVQGEKLFKVRNKFFYFLLPKIFICDRRGKKIAKVKKKKIFSFRKDYLLLGAQDELHIEGDILGWKFTLYKNGMPIAQINRDFSSVTNVAFREAFAVEVFNEEDAAFAVAVVIALDNFQDKLRNDRS